MIVKFFKSLFARDLARERAADLYRDIVRQSRTPYFYSDLGVPDTVEGRFDMITLHMFLVLRQLKTDKSHEIQNFAQKLFDEMFTSMDHALREMGVGDLSVGKKVRGLAEAFYGRVGVYEAALTEADGTALPTALARNIYEIDQISTHVKQLSEYVQQTNEKLKKQPLQRFTMGIANFVDVEEVTRKPSRADFKQTRQEGTTP